MAGQGQGRAGGGQGDVGQLGGVGIGVHGAVGDGDHALVAAGPGRVDHHEAARDDRAARRGADDLEARPQHGGRGVDGAGDHAVGLALLDHHAAEEERVGHRGGGLVPRQSLVAALLQEGVDVGLALGVGGGVHAVQAFFGKAQGCEVGADPGRVAQQHDAGEALVADGGGGAQRALVRGFGQDDAADMEGGLAAQPGGEVHGIPRLLEPFVAQDGRWRAGGNARPGNSGWRAWSCQTADRGGEGETEWPVSPPPDHKMKAPPAGGARSSARTRTVAHMDGVAGETESVFLACSIS